MNTTKSKLNRRTWNTYLTTCYMFDVANDQASAGGVHHYQVRKTSSGWQKRICQSNGRHQANGPIESIDYSEGLLLFARAEAY